MQPALSQRLADLESVVGVQLLVRSSQGAAPTPAGEDLYARALVIIKQVEAAQAAARSYSGHLAGAVHVGVLRTAASAVTPRLVLLTREKYPQIRLHVRVGYSAELASFVREGRVDIAMHVLPADEAKRQVPTIYSEGLCVVGPAQLMPRGRPLRIRDLDGIPLLLSSAQPSYTSIVDCAAHAGTTLCILGDVEDNRAALDICEAGAALTVQPESIAAIEARERGLAMALLAEPALKRSVGLITNPDIPPTAAVLAVQKVLADALQELVPLP